MTTASDRPAGVDLSGRRLLVATIVTGLGVSMSTLTASIVFVSLPSLATAFEVDLGTVQWVVMAYFIAVSSLHLSMGRIADLLGRLRVYQAGFVIFIVASSRTFGRACGQALWGGVFGMVVVSITGMAVGDSPVETLLSGYRVAFVAAGAVAGVAGLVSLYGKAA